MTAAQRHPWLQALRAAPARQVRALIDGIAAITPYERAEPGDAAAMLMGGLATDDPCRDAFDQGCLETLEALRLELRAADGEDFPFVAVALQRLLTVIRRLMPAKTIADLHHRYVLWHNALEAAMIDDSLDPRREFWRLLALTQKDNRRWMPLWLEICAQAGPWGRLNHTYLDCGLLGLRKLPLTGDIAANEEAVCHGLALWAAHQLPERSSFDSRWWEIEAAYPRSADFWPPLIGKILAAVISSRDGQDFPAARWWAEAMEVDDRHRGGQIGNDEDGLPEKKVRTDILADIDHALATLEPRIRALIAAYQSYADSSGDTSFLVRSACNIGKELLKAGVPTERATRGEVAISLARLALDYQPANPFAWSLWSSGLEDAGHGAAAEAVGWEALRRFPEDRMRATVLAKVLCLHGRFAEARRILELNRQSFPTHGFAYAQLAEVLADHLNQRPQAIIVLQDGIRHCPDDAVLPQLLAKAASGRRLTVPFPIQPLAQQPEDLALFPTLQAQRALVGWQAAVNDDERDQALAAVRQCLDRDPGLAYHHYVAAATGLAGESGGDTMFAVAFAQAMARHDQAGLGLLAPRTGSAHAALAQLALAEEQGQSPTLELPDTPATRRIKTIMAGTATARGRLRLLGDFAASELSLVSMPARAIA